MDLKTLLVFDLYILVKSYVSFQKQYYAMGNESNETSLLERIQILLRRQPSQASIRREVSFRY